MATLYEITSEYQELLSMMEDPETDPEIVRDTMEAIQGEFDIKADSYCIVIKELEAEQAKWKAERDRADRHYSVIGNHIVNLKEALLTSMLATGMTKLPTEHFKLSVAKNGGLQPMKITGDVPEEYCKLEPDNNKIREALKTGNLDFAHLEERGMHLNVR